MISRKIVLLVLPALLATGFPANAQAFEPDNAATCEVRPKQKHKKKRLGLGGLLSAAKRAGVGNVLGSGVLGDGRAAQIAGAAASTAVAASNGGNTTTVATDLAGSDRTAQAASAAASTAIRLVREASAECGKAE